MKVAHGNFSKKSHKEYNQLWLSAIQDPIRNIDIFVPLCGWDEYTKRCEYIKKESGQNGYKTSGICLETERMKFNNIGKKVQKGKVSKGNYSKRYGNRT